MKDFLIIGGIILLFLAIMAIIATTTAIGAEVSYASAYADYQQGKSMLLVIGAEWCPACHALRNSLRPSEVPYVYLDCGDPLVPKCCADVSNLPTMIVWHPKRKEPLRRIGNVGLNAIRSLLNPSN